MAMSRKSRTRTGVYVALGSTSVLLVAFTVMARMAPVVRRGALLPELGSYDELEQVRLLGMEPYVDVSSGWFDVVNAVLLAALALLTLAVSMVLRRRARSFTWEARSFLLIAPVAAFLAIDEVLAVHETIGHNMRFLAQLPFIHHAGDVLMLLYAAVVAALAWDRRALVMHAPLARRLLAVGVSLAVGAVLFDVVDGPWVVEEGLEVGAGAFLLMGVAALAFEHLQRTEAPATMSTLPTTDDVTSAARHVETA